MSQMKNDEHESFLVHTQTTINHTFEMLINNPFKQNDVHPLSMFHNLTYTFPKTRMCDITDYILTIYYPINHLDKPV